MVSVDPNLDAETVVGEFRQCVLRGDAINRNAPELLKRILRDGYWRRPDKDGKPFKYVEQFIAAPPLAGLGSDVDAIKRAVRDDPTALDLLDKAMTESGRKGARSDINNNVIEVEPCPQGNSRQRSLRTLREKAPELHALVIENKLSPNRAMIAAGLRDEQITVPASPAKAAKRLARHFKGERLKALIKALTEFQEDE